MDELIRQEQIKQEKLVAVAKNLREQFTELRNRSSGPFAGCDFCNSKCWVKYEGDRLSQDNVLDSDLLTALQQQHWEEVAKIARHMVSKITPGSKTSLERDLAICYLNHKLQRLGFSQPRIHLFIQQTKDELHHE
ncbi:MAG: hypothetical protein Q9P14_15975 [candidate division KSB1 bacterium]|nr:hypothetical protein [candidate division KSB1 bacterium]